MCVVYGKSLVMEFLLCDSEKCTLIQTTMRQRQRGVTYISVCARTVPSMRTTTTNRREEERIFRGNNNRKILLLTRFIASFGHFDVFDCLDVCVLPSCVIVATGPFRRNNSSSNEIAQPNQTHTISTVNSRHVTKEKENRKTQLVGRRSVVAAAAAAAAASCHCVYLCIRICLSRVRVWFGVTIW